MRQISFSVFYKSLILFQNKNIYLHILIFYVTIVQILFKQVHLSEFICANVKEKGITDEKNASHDYKSPFGQKQNQ